MRALAQDGRYEEAADVRDRARAFVDAHRRVRRFARLRRAGWLVLRHGSRRAVFDGGRFVAAESLDAPTLFGSAVGETATDPRPVDPADADELAVVCAWLDKNAHRIVVEHVAGVLACPLPRLPDLRGGATHERGDGISSASWARAATSRAMSCSHGAAGGCSRSMAPKTRNPKPTA